MSSEYLTTAEFIKTTESIEQRIYRFKVCFMLSQEIWRSLWRRLEELEPSLYEYTDWSSHANEDCMEQMIKLIREGKA